MLKGRRRATLAAGLGGCAELPAWGRRAALVWFAGDDAVRAAVALGWWHR